MIAAGLVTVTLIVLALTLTRPLPPHTVIMATGPEGGAYQVIGERYREIFAEHGVELELKTTYGSVDNVGLLRDPGSGVSVALVQSGMTDTDESPMLLSLGTLFYEPFWLFSGVGQLTTPKALQEMRVSLGRPGSGTYKLGRKVMNLLGLDLDRMQIQDIGAIEAGAALMGGELDFVGMSLPWEADIVQRLLRNPRIEPISWARADAYVALRPFLTKRTLPRGIADLANDRPPLDVTMIASKTSLIVHDDLHPALQHLFLEAASEIHSSPGVFNKAAEFPAAEPLDLPLSDIARQYYRSGKPLLQRYLPFWLAAYASRLLVILIPIFGIAYPLFRLLPAMYGWSMRRRILRLYGELKFLEAQIETNTSTASAAALEQLDRLEKRVNRMRVSTAFNQMLYTMKQHIQLVRERITNHPSESQDGTPAQEDQSSGT